MSLIDVCKDKAAFHVEVYPVFGYNGTSYTLETPNGITEFDDFDGDGLNYLAYRLKYSSSKFLKGKSPKDLCQELNKAFKAMTARETFVAAFTRHGSSLYLSGFLTSYIPKHHWEVVEFLQENGYEPTFWNLTTKEMRLYFKGSSYGKIQFGCMIHNGETGHVSIGYRFYLKSGNLAVDVPFRHRNRHQSRVEDVFGNLETIFNSIKELNIDAVLELPTSEFALIIEDLGGEKFAPFYLQYARMPIAFFLAEIGERIEERGFKTVGTQLLEKLTQAIVERA